MLVYIIIAVLLAAALFYIYAFRYEPFNFKLSEVGICLRQEGKKRVEGKCKPFLTVLHLSDFHLRKNLKGKKMFEFVQGLAKYEPDLLFITGDLVDRNENMPYLIEMLKPLKARYGKFAVLGVHDYYDKKISEFFKNMIRKKKNYMVENDISGLKDKLAEIGVEVLQNRTVKLESPDRDIKGVSIVGIDDPMLEKSDVSLALGQNEMAGKKDQGYDDEKYKEYFKIKDKDFHLLEEQEELLLCLMHTPDSNAIIDLAERGANIIFCGHTHGGQVRLPAAGAVLSGCRLKTRYASGLFYFKKFVLYVSRGLSEGRFSQFRVLCPPEATLINIYRG